jgi:hypothetical protein
MRRQPAGRDVLGQSGPPSRRFLPGPAFALAGDRGDDGGQSKDLYEHPFPREHSTSPFGVPGAAPGLCDPLTPGGVTVCHAAARINTPQGTPYSSPHAVAGRQLFKGLTRELRATASWVAWIRLAAVPFVFMEVAIERGNYPTGYEGWAWAVAAVFAVGAASLFWSHRRGLDIGFVAYAFDAAVVSAFVAVYSFEPGSPVRQLLFLPVIEAALRWGRLGGVLSPLASAPALAVFEWKVSDRLGVPYDPGHVVFPVALQLLVGLIVGSLSERLRANG